MITVLSCFFGMFAGAILMWLFVYANTGHKKRGLTDRLYMVNMIFVIITVTASYTAIFLSGKLGITDLSPISMIVPSAFGELGLHTGFIIWKAKAENCRKHKDVNAMTEMEQEVDDV